MNIPWDDHGISVGCQLSDHGLWDAHGQIMGIPWAPWAVDAQLMDCPVRTHELSGGQPVGIPRAANGQPMGISWAAHGQSTDNPLAAHRLPTNSLWASHSPWALN